MKVEKMADKIEHALYSYNADTYNPVQFARKGITEIARRAIESKETLHEILSKHPNWDEETWTVKLNIKRNQEHDSDYENRILLGIRGLFHLNDYSPSSLNYRFIIDISWWFVMAKTRGDAYRNNPDNLPPTVNDFCPDAWHKGRKLTKILSSALKEFGIWEDKPGVFQRKFAAVCELLKDSKESVTLYVSINPAHFLTMSNPKKSKSGNMLTSCHSINSSEYQYNNGCSGYAIDEVTMIAFTVDNPDDEELQYYRKTSRQLFMYKPSSGILVQSRMYNSDGGTEGITAWTNDYRKAVLDLITECEGNTHDWITKPYYHNDYEFTLYTDPYFGGYPDWRYEEFCANLSVRTDSPLLTGRKSQDFEVGATGICLVCGDEISKYAVCPECSDEHCCDWCDETHTGNFHTVYDYNDVPINVCEECFEECFKKCPVCGNYHPTSSFETVDGVLMCDHCAGQFFRCDGCAERSASVQRFISSSGTPYFFHTGCCAHPESFVWVDSAKAYIVKSLYSSDCEGCIGLGCVDCARGRS